MKMQLILKKCKNKNGLFVIKYYHNNQTLGCGMCVLSNLLTCNVHAEVRAEKDGTVHLL